MGTDKALLRVDGVPMARRVADALEAGGASSVVCIGGDAAALEALGLEVVPDEHPGEGPLGGLLTALDLAAYEQRDAVVVSACDHPWLDGESVADLLTGLLLAPLARPATDGGHPPLLFAAKVGAALPIVRDLFDGGERSLQWLGAHLEVSTVHGIPPQALRDVDRPEDLS